MKRILVTGGAGFLGSNLCKKLLSQQGCHVIALDNLFTGRMSNLDEIINNPNFEFIKHDVMEPMDIRVDEIYNAACPASPPYYQLSPTTTTKTCILGIINVLDLAKKYNAKIVHFSTSEVYGDPLAHPQTEDYRGHVNPIGIRSCYDEGKRCAESLCFDYHREFATQIKVIRIFNTYGPNMDPKDGRVVSNLIVQALKGQNITIYGDGNQTRSFCYVNDLIEAIISMMSSKKNIIGPVNLGNPEEFTMLDLARLIIKKTSAASRIVFFPLPMDDPAQRRPDITLASRILNWKPIVTLDEGLDRTIEYFKGQKLL